LARLVGRHSTIRRIASRHYSAEGSLRMCRRLQRALRNSSKHVPRSQDYSGNTIPRLIEQ
jgi:hypothetical protein